MTEAKQADPPSWLQSRHFMVGKDSRGNWVVQDPRGNCGGLFVDRDAALRFVRAENGYRTPAVVMVSGNLELNTRPIRARYPFLKQPSMQRQRA